MMGRNLFAKVLGLFRLPRLQPNKPSYEDGSAVIEEQGYRLLVVEFDDQGICFDRNKAIERLSALLEELRAANPIIVTFVHGWKHNAQNGDSNLGKFRELLMHTAAAGVAQRPVVGVYLAWRGLSRCGNLLWTETSFWGRHKAAQRIAQGTPREVLGRLKAFRNGTPGQKPQATLVVVGHSFGGLIVYTAIAQSLIEAAASEGRIAPSFGDLVLLVNPAFSAVSYMPLWSIVASKQFDEHQLPVCVSVTALNDWATRIAYPLGTFLRQFNELWSDPKERQALFHTMGHLPWLRTHELKLRGDGGGKAAAAVTAQYDAGNRRAAAHEALLQLAKGKSQTFGDVSVDIVRNVRPSPFWVASATKEIIDGHNGIFTDTFIAFVRALIEAHLKEDLPLDPAQETLPPQVSHVSRSFTPQP